MTSNEKLSYTNRIENALNVAQVLQSFSSYNPTKQKCSIKSLLEHIDTVKALNKLHDEQSKLVAKTAIYRKDFFTNSHNGLNALLTPLEANVKSCYGIQNPITNQIIAITTKLKLSLTKKLNDDNSNLNFEKKTKLLHKIIQIIRKDPNKYLPINPLISLHGLQTIYKTIAMANESYNKAKFELSIIQKTRIEAYKKLTITLIDIKNFTRTHYGFKSKEFQSLKNLPI
jgi:hypothetical protein